MVKSDAIMQMDDNVWNDKNTDDFLRYLKFEFFMLNYMISFAIVDVLVGWVCYGNMHVFGEKDWSTTKIFIVITS